MQSLYMCNNVTDVFAPCITIFTYLLEAKCIGLYSEKQMHSKFPILLYGLKCYSLVKADIRSLDFVVKRFLHGF